MKYTSFLTSKLNEFVKHRIASMCWNKSYDDWLLAFDRYIVEQYPNASVLTDEIISLWCRKKESETRTSCRRRIYPVVNLVKFLNERYYTNFADVDVPKRETRKYIPHAFSKEELIRFFSECNRAHFKGSDENVIRRNLVVPVIFRLLYSTGMRNIEVRMLKRSDVDLDDGVITIVISKGYDQRRVVMHDTMLDLMKQFDLLISQTCPNRVYFFPGFNDNYITQRWLYDIFRNLWAKVSSKRSVIYDFRHNYAVQNINGWLSSGLAYHQKLIYLSKSMGHRDVEGTRYYYTLVPAMAEILEQQTEKPFNELVPEVQHEKNF